MVKCVFCSKEQASHKGLHYIKNDGSVNYFCSGKCRKNALKLGRDKRKVMWTDAYRVELRKAILKAEAKAKALEVAKTSSSKANKK